MSLHPKKYSSRWDALSCFTRFNYHFVRSCFTVKPFSVHLFQLWNRPMCSCFSSETNQCAVVSFVKSINVQLFQLWNQSMFSFYDILRRERSIYFVLASRIENTHVFHSRSQFFFRRHIHEFTETRFIVVTVREINILNRVKGGFYWYYPYIFNISFDVYVYTLTSQKLGNCYWWSCTRWFI